MLSFDIRLDLGVITSTIHLSQHFVVLPSLDSKLSHIELTTTCYAYRLAIVSHPTLPSDFESWLATAPREALVAKLRELSNQTTIMSTSTAERSVIVEVKNDFEAVTAWLNSYQKRSPDTLRAFKLEAERFLIWLCWTKGRSDTHLPNVTLSDITSYWHFLSHPTAIPNDVLDIFNRKQENQPFSGKPLKAASQNRTRNVLMRMFDALQQLRGPFGRYVEFNPWTHLKPEKAHDTEEVERFLSQEEWSAIRHVLDTLPSTTPLDAAKAAQYRWVMNLLYFGFLRRSETSNLVFGDFYPQRNGWWVRIPRGKGNKSRKVACPSLLMDELVRYRRFLGLSDYPSPEEPYPAIWPIRGTHLWKENPNSCRQLTDRAIYEIAKKVFDLTRNYLEGINPHLAANMAKSSTHWMRHTGISHSMDAGIDPRIVQSQAGHSSLRITARYDHKQSDHWSEAMEKL